MTSRLLNRHQVQECIGISRSSLYRLMRAGLFPNANQGWRQGSAVGILGN